jgi:hypothetical protein
MPVGKGNKLVPLDSLVFKVTTIGKGNLTLKFLFTPLKLNFN